MDEQRVREIVREELAEVLRKASKQVRPSTGKLVFDTRELLDKRREEAKNSHQSN